MSEPRKEPQENKSIQDKKEVSDFYDMVIKIDSFRNLKKKEDGHFGWDIIYGKEFNYKERTQEELVKIGVLGNRNRGKSFILSKLANYNIPSGYNIKTEGLSIKFKNSYGIVFIDSAGFETPLMETNNLQLEQITELSLKEENEKKNLLANDRAIIEVFIQQYILKTADIIIVVVGQLTYSEQQLLLRIKRDSIKKKIFVVHNLLNLVTKAQVQDYINNVLLKSLAFTLKKADIVSLDYETETVDKNDSYYHEDYDDGYCISHLIMAKDETEAGKYYNETAITFLLNNFCCVSKVSKYQVKLSIKNFLYRMSGILFENPIRKPEKGKKGYIFDELTIGEQKIPKFYIDNYDKDIILKSIRINSLGFKKFYGYQRYCFLYIVDDIKKNRSKNSSLKLKTKTKKNNVL